MKLTIGISMKKSNEYLYGEDIEVPEIPQEIVVRRIELLNEHLEEILAEPYFSREAFRCNAVIKALSFWENINNKDI